MKKNIKHNAKHNVRNDTQSGIKKEMQEWKNVFFAMSAQPKKIQLTESKTTEFWGAGVALIFLFSCQNNQGMIILQILPLILFALAPPKMRTKNFIKNTLMICATAPILPILLTLLDAHGLSVAASIFVSLRTIFEVMKPGFEKEAHPFPPASAPEETGYDAQNLRRLRQRSSGRIVLIGPKIGILDGHSIVEWFVDERGIKHTFSRAWTGSSIPILAEDETLMPPGLIFVKSKESKDQ
jgi:hypothetical protein